MSKIEPKPCPFPGCGNTEIWARTVHKSLGMVECLRCHAFVKAPTLELAVAEWNCRGGGREERNMTMELPDEPTSEPCDECGYLYGDSVVIDVECPYCRSGNAKRNGVTSKGDQRWQCRVCGKGFLQSGPMKPRPKCGGAVKTNELCAECGGTKSVRRYWPASTSTNGVLVPCPECGGKDGVK